MVAPRHTATLAGYRPQNDSLGIGTEQSLVCRNVGVKFAGGCLSSDGGKPNVKRPRLIEGNTEPHKRGRLGYDGGSDSSPGGGSTGGYS